jgi:hypothetical protein
MANQPETFDGKSQKRKGEKSFINFYGDLADGTFVVATGPTSDDSSAVAPFVTVYDSTQPPPGNALTDFENLPLGYIQPTGDELVGGWKFDTTDSQILQGSWYRVRLTAWLIITKNGVSVTDKRIWNVKCDIL